MITAKDLFCLLCLAPVALGFTPGGATESEAYRQEWTALERSTQDAIVANVGGTILLLSDLRSAVALASKGKSEITPSGSLLGDGMKPTEIQDVLDKLIEQSILEIKVKELSLEVTESELDDEIAQFLRQRDISHSDFLRMVAAEGETEQTHRAEFKRQIETQRFIGRVIKPLVTVTDEEVRSFYLSQRSDGVQASEKLTLRSLMLRGRTSEPGIGKRIESIRAAINGGTAFEVVTKQNSDAPDANSSGGLLPPRKSSELPPTVAAQLKDKPLGTIVGPIEIGSSSFMFELVARESVDDTQFLRERDTWKQRLLERKFGERLKSYLKSERDKVRVEVRPMEFVNRAAGVPDQAAGGPKS